MKSLMIFDINSKKNLLFNSNLKLNALVSEGFGLCKINLRSKIPQIDIQDIKLVKCKSDSRQRLFRTNMQQK